MNDLDLFKDDGDDLLEKLLDLPVEKRDNIRMMLIKIKLYELKNEIKEKNEHLTIYKRIVKKVRRFN